MAETIITNMTMLEVQGRVFWMDKEELQTCKLAPHMEKYLQVFLGDYSECFCTYKDNYAPLYR